MSTLTTFVTRQGLAVRAEPGVQPLPRADMETLVEVLLGSFPEFCRKRFKGTLLVLQREALGGPQEYVFGGIRWPQERVVRAHDYDGARANLRHYLETLCLQEGAPLGEIEPEDSLVLALNSVRDSFEASRENLAAASRILDRHKGSKP